MKRYGLFIWIPKNAGSSLVNTVLKGKFGFEKRKYPGAFDTFNNDNHVTFVHLSVQELLAAGHISQEFYQNAYKFCFVRNPYDRLVSAWKYNGDVEGKHTLDFEGYVKEVAEKIDTKEGLPHIGLWNQRGFVHANRQVDWIVDDIDFIGRFETLQKDFNQICDALDLPRTQLPHENQSNRRPYQDYYTEEAREIVTEIYKEDIERFGYTF